MHTYCLPSGKVEKEKRMKTSAHLLQRESKLVFFTMKIRTVNLSHIYRIQKIRMTDLQHLKDIRDLRLSKLQGSVHRMESV